VRNEIRTSQDIAIQLCESMEKVNEVINEMCDEGWLKIDDNNCLYLPDVVDEVLKSNELSKKRSEAAKQGSDSAGRPKKEPATYSKEFLDSFKKYVEAVNSVFGSGFKTNKLHEKSVQQKAKKNYKLRIAEGYKPDEFKSVMEAIKEDEYHAGNGYRYVTPEFICREDKFYRFLNIAKKSVKEEPRTGGNQYDKLMDGEA
jgi:uncharacterized phage protein (TIGR02220 family)